MNWSILFLECFASFIFFLNSHLAAHPKSLSLYFRSFSDFFKKTYPDSDFCFGEAVSFFGNITTRGRFKKTIHELIYCDAHMQVRIWIPSVRWLGR